jgi:hypothetical protein
MADTLMTRYNIPALLSPYATMEFKNIVLMEMMAKIDGEENSFAEFMYHYISFLSVNDPKECRYYEKVFLKWKAAQNQ